MKWFVSLMWEMFKIFKKKEPNIPIVIKKEEEEKPQDEFLGLKHASHGIDLSHHNRTISFELVKQDFIFLKATQGAKFVDPTFSPRIKVAMARGIKCGAYHYYVPDINPIIQAKHFCKNLKGNLPPVLDIEAKYEDRNKLILDLKQFLTFVEAFCGKTPIIYSYHDYLKNLNLPEEFSRYPLWLAWYTKPEKVQTPSPWKDWTFWQYSDSRKVNGVHGFCDVNIFKGIKNERISQTGS